VEVLDPSPRLRHKTPVAVVESLFVMFSAGLVLVGLVMVGAAVRAYVQTERR